METERINETDALKAELALRYCKCCGRPLNIYVQPGMRPTSPVYEYGTCFNEGCSRYTITREIHDLYALTDEQVSQFHTIINKSA